MSKNVPTNKKLYARVKAEAKRKFDRWPSAYGSAWLVREYKKRGGRYRKAQMGMEVDNPYADMYSVGGGIMTGDYEMEYGGMPEYKNGGGIPQRYRNMGFTKVGAKKKSTRPGKKWMVLAKKGDKYKVVHGGDSNMKDFKQHGSAKRKKRFWDRMGGRNSAKAKDPFSPLYWHKRFGTWAEGGEFEPHMMYNPNTGQGFMADQYEDHLRMDKMGFTHEAPSFEEGGVISPKGDPYEYKRSGDKFLTRKRGSKNWITAKGAALDAIKTKIYNIPAEEEVPMYGYNAFAKNKLGAPAPASAPAPVYNTPMQGAGFSNEIEGMSGSEYRLPVVPAALTTPPVFMEKPQPLSQNRFNKSLPKLEPQTVEEVQNSLAKNTKQSPIVLDDPGSIDLKFAKDFYKNNNIKKDYIFVVDKPTGAMYQVNLSDGKYKYLDEVGLGRNVGDRDTSKGRSSGKGSYQTQSGWVKINREKDFTKRNKNYGDEFNGFSAFVNGSWKEIPTGIHGTMNEDCGRVSGGCTRMGEKLEDATRDMLDKNTLLYYTSDNSKGLFEKGATNNPGFRALPPEVQDKIRANMEMGGDLYRMGGMPCYECGGTMKYGGMPKYQFAGSTPMNPFTDEEEQYMQQTYGTPADNTELPNLSINPVEFEEQEEDFNFQFIPGKSDNMRTTKNWMMQTEAGKLPTFTHRSGRKFNLDKAFENVDALSGLAGMIGRNAKQSRQLQQNKQRQFTDNLYDPIRAGEMGSRGDYNISGQFRPDRVANWNSYMAESFNTTPFYQEGGVTEMSDAEIERLRAMGADIEILD